MPAKPLRTIASRILENKQEQDSNVDMRTKTVQGYSNKSDAMEAST